MTLFAARYIFRLRPRVSVFFSAVGSTHSVLTRFIRTSSVVKGVIFPDRENSLFHSILREKPELQKTLIPAKELETTEQVSSEEFAAVVGREWSEAPPEEVAAAFHRVSAFASANGILFSDDRVIGITAALQRVCAALSDEELMRCVSDLRAWPQAPSAFEQSFHTLWSALDGACAARAPKLSKEALLLLADHWAALRLAGRGNYVEVALRRLLRRPSSLPAAQLIQAMYYANTQRRPSQVVDMVEVEVAIENRLDALSLDDLGIVAAAFFKSQCKIHSERLLSHMLNKTTEEALRVREIPLAALLKAARYSAPLSLSQRLYALLDRLQEELPRLSLLACSHAALAGTNMQLLHEGLVRKALARLTEQASELRLKELERTALVTGLFDLPAEKTETISRPRPTAPAPAAFVVSAAPAPCPGALEAAVERELRARLGSEEMAKHKKSLPRALFFLSLRRVFPKDLIAAVLHPDGLRDAYGKSAHAFDLELLGLDMAMQLECSDYDGPRLTPKERAIVTKKFRTRLPSESGEERGSYADRLLAQLLSAARIFAGDDGAAARHLLPHHARADVVLRLSMGEGTSGEEPHCLPLPQDFLLAPAQGEPRPAPALPPEGDAAASRERWVALIAGSWNAFVHGDGGGCRLTGYMASRTRQLALIGYTPVVVPWFEWNRLPKAQRVDYIREIIRAAAAAPAGAILSPAPVLHGATSNDHETASVSL